jgi:putative Mn2+ efflux pump MntP
MNTGKLMVGAIVIAVAVWMMFLMPTDSPTAKYLGGTIVAIVGVAMLIEGFKKKK